MRRWKRLSGTSSNAVPDGSVPEEEVSFRGMVLEVLQSFPGRSPGRVGHGPDQRPGQAWESNTNSDETPELSTARLGDLVEPDLSGLPPFLADGTPGSSGIMILEYV